MKIVTITDTRNKYPSTTITVDDDANVYSLIQKHVVANGGKVYKIGMSSSAYFGRFFVREQKEIGE